MRKNFFYIRTNNVTKIRGEKYARINFSRNRRVVRTKNVGKKTVGNRAKKRFLFSLEYLDQKWGNNKSETFFPETQT